MGTCKTCHKRSSLISRELGLCLDCIRCRPEEAREIALGVHARIRSEWGLPGEPPRHPEGIVCDLCVNRCRIGEGGWGYCGLRKNDGGRMEGVSATRGKLFDLKAWDDTLHVALTGITNRRTIENFERLAKRMPSRPEPPLLIASTLMVPGYVDAQEVGQIAGFIASLDPEIPYSLLAFHPQYRMTDLAATSRKQAKACLDATKQAGLRRVRVGNVHLLW